MPNSPATAVPLSVGYDEQVLLAQTRGGISRYVVQLVAGLRAEPDLGVEPVPGWRWSPNAHAGEAGLSRPLPGTAALPRPVQLGVSYLANTGPRRHARRAHVLHHTYYHPHFLTRSLRGIRVSTVYDMIPELYPEAFAGADPHLAKRAYVAASDVILCISQSTRRDLVEVYGDTGVPMPITYLGVDDRFRPGLTRLPGLPDRYLLFVGRRAGYKDFDVLAQALADLPRDGTALVAVGGGPFTDVERHRLLRLGVADRVRRIEATDAELPRVYAGALAFVFPSRHEGFGLPTLEAMACGVPAVLANSSSHPEVGGKVAQYFPPGDVGALTNVLHALLGDELLRADLGRQGVARAADFSWAHTARSTALAYRAAVAW